MAGVFGADEVIVSKTNISSPDVDHFVPKQKICGMYQYP